MLVRSPITHRLMHRTIAVYWASGKFLDLSTNQGHRTVRFVTKMPYLGLCHGILSYQIWSVILSYRRYADRLPFWYYATISKVTEHKAKRGHQLKFR